MIDILIVEDDLLTRIGVTSILNAHPEKYHVIGQADNGKDALEMVHTLDPHIILTDIKMPIMDGIAFITALRQENYPGRIIILSAYNEFSYVREGMRLGADDYLLKLELNPEHLCSTLDHAAQKLNIHPAELPKQPPKQNREMEGEHLFTYHAFTREYASDDELKELGMEMGVTHFPDCFFCLIIESPLKGASGNSFSSIFDTARTLLANYNMNSFFSCIIDINIAGFILPLKSSEKPPSDMTQEISTYFQNTFNLELHVYISSIYQQLCNVSQFFFRNFKRSNRHYISTNSDRNTSHTDSLKQELTLLSTALSDGSIQEILTAFDTLLLAIEKRCDTSPKMLHGICHLLIHFVDDYLNRMSCLEVTWVRTDQTLHLVKDCHTRSDYIRYIHSLKAIFQEVQSHPREPSFIEMAKAYIQEYYQQNLQIEDIARHAHVSVSYLSKSFSSITGVTVTEYINTVRIKAAKKLLRETELPIYQISEAVGYNSSYYFCRIFKKATDLTPLQYRNHTTS